MCGCCAGVRAVVSVKVRIGLELRVALGDA